MTARRAKAASTPAALGYRMPAEWEPHAATWIAWPHFRGDWPGKFDPIPWVYAEIIRHLARSERVELMINNSTAEKKARKTLERAAVPLANVRFHRWPTDRVWTRDSGCIFLTSGQWSEGQPALRERSDRTGPRPSGASEARQLALHFRFNAWAKYPNYAHDAKLGARMARVAKAKVVNPVAGKERVVLEGGSLDVNGRGVMLTTEECLLSNIQERNPGFSRPDYERLFEEYFGVQKVLWMGNGIAGDDTHGHVDDITRFVADDTILTMVESNSNDVNYEPLVENLRRLRSATRLDGKKFRIVELPMPSPVYFEGRRLPASYANFYIANEVVLVPVFNDPNDRIALNTLANLFPTRDVIPIYSGDFIWGFGAMHCMTQQQPAG
jgi:agmatine deiminase